MSIHSRTIRTGCLIVWGLVFMGSVQAQDNPKRPQVENDMFRLSLMPRTPDQMAGFYEGRGFPSSATALVKQACFITTIFRNKSDRVIWLELSNWRIVTAQGEVKRLDRDYWKKRWQGINLSLAHRSTFGWTLLPEVRDLQPHENVGGNLVLPPLQQPFTLKAYFATGKDKRGTGINVEFNNIQCAKDKKPS
jgi:hypothetical protein